MVLPFPYFRWPETNRGVELRYAMQRTSDSVTVWFWARESASVPWDVANGANFIITDNWVCPLVLGWEVLLTCHQ
jgi:hypothetical protein